SLYLPVVPGARAGDQRPAAVVACRLSGRRELLAPAPAAAAARVEAAAGRARKGAVRSEAQACARCAAEVGPVALLTSILGAVAAGRRCSRERIAAARIECAPDGAGQCPRCEAEALAGHSTQVGAVADLAAGDVVVAAEAPAHLRPLPFAALQHRTLAAPVQ